MYYVCYYVNYVCYYVNYLWYYVNFGDFWCCQTSLNLTGTKKKLDGVYAEGIAVGVALARTKWSRLRRGQPSA